MAYENILVEAKNHVGFITLNRQKALNALSAGLIQDLGDALKSFDDDSSIKVVVITGNEKAFAAGADIKEMLAMDYTEMETHDRRESLLQMGVMTCSKPIVGAVSGFALGGGCELAMTCDILIAGENAMFGQPEINLGIMAGAGGTQRLPAAVGKSLAMQMNLTGEPIDAQRALLAGLVSEVVADPLERAEAVAAKIATKSLPPIRKIKDAVNSSFEHASLMEGIKYEHLRFISCWATEDQKIGMNAFANKEKPDWKHK